MITAELFKYGLFWILPKSFGFHRNECKTQIIYGNVTQGWYTLFQNLIHLFMGCSQFFHLMLFLFSIIVYYGVQKLKDKHFFRKILIIHVWHMASSVAKHEILWTSVIVYDFKCVLSKSQYRLEFLNLKLGLEMCLNFCPCVYFNSKNNRRWSFARLRS